MPAAQRFWHTTGNGIAYSGDPNWDCQTAEEYKSKVRKAYGSLRGVRCYERLLATANPGLLVYPWSQLSKSQQAWFRLI